MFGISPTAEQVQSLAGMLQSAALVVQLAHQDRFDQAALHASTYSLIKLDSASVEDLYGGIFGIDLGLRTMAKLFSSRLDRIDSAAQDIFRYSAATHRLARKLQRLQQTATMVHDRLEGLSQQYLEFQQDEARDLELQAELSDLYSRTMSFITPRIIVQGSSGRLQEADTVNRVRTALFSGVRASFMWHQFGGRRFHLLLVRERYAKIAQSMLAR